jgi:hypothetical protein
MVDGYGGEYLFALHGTLMQRREEKPFTNGVNTTISASILGSPPATVFWIQDSLD